MSPRTLVAGMAGLALVALALVFLVRRPAENVRAQPARFGTEAAASAEDRLAEAARGDAASVVRPTPVRAAAQSAAQTGEAIEARPAPAAKAALFVVHGTLLGRSGEVLRSRNPYLSATDAAGDRVGTNASPDGHYALTGLAPGPWTLTASAQGHRMVQASLELGANQPIVRRDFVLEPSVVLPVRVLTTAGQPLSQALRERGQSGARNAVRPLPVATREPPGPTIQDAVDAGNNRVGVGNFRDYGSLVEGLGPECLGALEIEGDLPVSVSLVVGARVVATQRVEPGASEARFTVDIDELLAQQAVVRARFVDEASGAALQGSLDIEPLDSGAYVRDGDWSQTLPPGRYTLRFDSQGHARIPIALELTAGQELDLGEVRVPLGLTIEGRLLDAEGQPVLSDLELGQRDASGKLRFDQSVSYRSDASGNYRIPALVAGRFVLRTAGDDEIVHPGRDEPPTIWVSGNVPVSTLGGSVTGFDLQLVRAGILVLKGAQTQPEGTRIKILDEHGDLLRWNAIYPGFVPRFALPPGPCTLILCDEDWSERSRHALVIAAGVNELDLTR